MGAGFFLGDGIDRLDHGSTRQHTVEIVADVRVGLDNRDLGDGVEVATLIEQHVDMRERFQSAPEPTLGLPHPLGHRSHLAPVGTEEHHDLVGLSERVSAQHDALVLP